MEYKFYAIINVELEKAIELNEKGETINGEPYYCTYDEIFKCQSPKEMIEELKRRGWEDHWFCIEIYTTDKKGLRDYDSEFYSIADFIAKYGKEN